MQRLAQAPNITIAQLWVDMLRQEGIDATMQRYFISSAAGEVPPDQCLPELWVMRDEQLERAKLVLHDLRHIPQRRWLCAGCGEVVEGGFTQCWNCGVADPALSYNEN